VTQLPLNRTLPVPAPLSAKFASAKGQYNDSIYHAFDRFGYRLQVIDLVCEIGSRKRPMRRQVTLDAIAARPGLVAEPQPDSLSAELADQAI
jgi:hypothetical protein